MAIPAAALAVPATAATATATAASGPVVPAPVTTAAAMLVGVTDPSNKNHPPSIVSFALHHLFTCTGTNPKNSPFIHATVSYCGSCVFKVLFEALSLCIG